MIEGKVYKWIQKRIAEDGGLTFLQLDPPKFELKDIPALAKTAEENGLDAFAVGGSVGAQGELLDKTILALKENSSLPVILFPGNIATLSKHADAIYFMSMLNSLDPYWITGAQTASSLPIKKMGLEVIPTSYIIVEPGRAVGWIGRAKAIPRELPYLGAITALAGQFMGSKLIILESGGGAPSPAPEEMVKQTKKLVGIPLLVAGGVRNEKFAYDTIKAGADIIHVGTAIEDAALGGKQKMAETFKKLTSAVKKAGKEKK
ncbi:MAG: geranylgeranylglyceryl/heptaprenylglyceryl phosphate synthase [Candidatus Diapherotrites archaeon]